jgi:uncharacterized protein (TIRG00374 family)
MDAATARSGRVKRRVSVVFVLGVLSVVAFGLILHFVGFRQTLAALADAGPLAFVATFLLAVVWLLFVALGWALLSHPVGHRIPLATLFGGVLIGFVGNYITPSMYVGGEALRAAYVSRKCRLPAYQVAGTVILSKYLEFMAFALMVCLATVVALVHYGTVLSTPLYHVWRVAMIGGAAVLATVLVLLLVALWGRHRPLSAVVRFFIRMRLFHHALDRVRIAVQRMEDQMSGTFNRQGRWAWTAFGVLCLGLVALFLRPLVFFCFLRHQHVVFNFAELCLIFALTQLVLGFQITPGSLGTYEGGMIGIFTILGRAGLTSDLAMAYVLCVRSSELVLLIAGALLGTHQGLKIVKLARSAKRAGEAPIEAALDDET